MAEITGDVVNLTQEEIEAQKNNMSSLIDSINASNTSFTEEQKQKEAELKQKENDDYFKYTNEVYATKSKNFALASEEDHQKLLERIKEAEDIDKSAKKSNFFADTLHKVSVLSKQAMFSKDEKKRLEEKEKREPNTVQEIEINNEANEAKIIAKPVEKVSNGGDIDYYYLATHDQLTGLKNRRAFDEDQKTLILDQCSIISVDVNNLKYMNDNYGHEIGDLLIKSVGNALAHNFDIENSYRFGGDEFLAICKRKHQAKTKVKRTLKELDKLTKKHNNEGYVFSASFGIAEFGDVEDDDINKMLKRADERMYEEKELYKKANSQYDMRAIQENNQQIQETQINREEIKAQVREELLKEQEEQKQKELLEKQKAEEAKRPKTADDLTTDEYNNQLSQELQEVKEQAIENTVSNKVSLSRILNNIQQREMDGSSQLFYICIATIDMNALIILRNTRQFLDLMEEADVDYVSCSYIYALFSSGAAWYGNNLPVTGVQKIFDAMVNACIAKRGRPLSNDDILKIPDIDMFKDIYMQ